MPITACYAVPHPPMLIPEVGRGDETAAADTAKSYERFAREIAAIKPETIVVVTPHSVVHTDYFHISPPREASGDLGSFGAPDISLSVLYDAEFINELCAQAKTAGIKAGTNGEKDACLDHGTMIPLYYAKKYYSDFKAVRISVSSLDYFTHYDLGRLIAAAAESTGKKTVFVASGDLSHKLSEKSPYGPSMEGKSFDAAVLDAFETAEFDKLINISEDFSEGACECGLRCFIVMAGVLDKKSVSPEIYSYEGPFGVGYAFAHFPVGGFDKSRDFIKKIRDEHTLRLNCKENDCFVSLAGYVTKNYIKTGRVPDLPEGLPPEMTGKSAGVFVSIKKLGNLRGCVGTILPMHGDIAHEIRANAISAAVGDNRFPPVTEDELPLLSYSVDVLKQLEPVTSVDMLDISKYGIVVRNEYKKGLLLPNLDGVDSVPSQIDIAKKKAGIGDGEEYIIERFEVERHK